MDNYIFSVSELNEHIKDLVESDPTLARIYVRGEISNYKVYPSGHHYFTLKDQEGALKAVMFRASASKLKFRPENGMKVIAFGRISVYPRDGAYQLYANALTPDGVGDLHVAFEQLKEKLYNEGLFDSRHKKPIPACPETIAVITSSAGAAVRDIIRVLGKRWPMAKVVVLPVRVQGVEAPPEIVGAIRYANRHKVADLIITGRGGGSIEDLWAFNDERVARAIFSSEIPVISAVGHEPDVTISDFVADLRAATPSNAAELAVWDQAEVRDALDSLETRLAHAMRRKFDSLRSRVDELSSRRVMIAPEVYVQDKRLYLDRMQDRLSSAQLRAVSRQREKYARLAASLDAMSPLKVLGRGYAIAAHENGAIIRSAKEVKSGDRIKIRLKEDEISCTAD
ncbi:MAG: exodeoxyribonuclease VII large subunit [Oscillospiraceae bacterium]|nr:exodeoxyribonuclease VII large subunit [Oscillospiraceae bacterium]